MIDIDASQLNQLAADLAENARGSAVNVRKAVEVTARYIRDDWRQALRDSAALPHGSRAVTYEVAVDASSRTISAEIGPEDKRMQGLYVGLIEYGTPSVAPRGYGAAALENNIHDFERGLLEAIEFDL